MIGMNFASFVMLLILGLIAAVVIHAVRYRFVEGFDGFAAKWIAGWIGAWLGSAVIGHWWFQIQNVYVVPALLGAFVGSFSLVFLMKATAIARGAALPKTAPATALPELRKAS